MIVIDFEAQIQPGTFEYALHHHISNRLDLAVFYSKYDNEIGGRAAYDPAILLQIILFAYSKGITSSREIQWSCEHNVIFKALSCDSVPHFTTIASFVSQYPDALADLFEQIVLVCEEEGLIGKELFAIDGCKMPSNASKERSGTHKELAEKRKKVRRELNRCIREHQRLDRRKKGEKERANRLEQTIDTLDNAFQKIDRFLESNEPRMGQGKNRKEVKSNITNNESAKMVTSKGTLQGYNGVATVDKKHQVVVDAQAFGEDMWLKSELTTTYGTQKVFFEGRLSKCRSCPLKMQCMRNPDSPNDRKGTGRQVSFIVESNKTATDWMKKRVDSKKGKEIYSHRMSVVEPVFGNIGTNKGLSRFSLRGKDKVQGQWRLFCLVYNIEKLQKYGESFQKAA